MAGFGGALARVFAGAVGGYGTGLISEVENARAQKKEQLAADRADRQFAMQAQLTREEGAANRASQEKLTTAQLAVSERLGKLQAETSRYGTDVGATLTREQINARRDEVAAQIASGEKIAGMQEDTQRDLAQAQIDAQKDLNVTFQTQKDGTSVMMRGGKPVKMPIDPNTGKPMDPAITDNDTNEAKNVKYLLTLGVDKEKAMALVYNAKNANRDLAQAGIFKSIVDGMSTMKNLGEEDFDFAQKKAKTITDSIYGPEAPAAPAAPAAPGATAPAAETSATAPAAADTKFPPGTTPEQGVAWAQSMIKAGKSRTAIKKVLQDNGIDPAKAGL